MITVVQRTRLAAPAATIFAWHLRPDAIRILTHPFGVRVIKPPASLRDGEQAELRVPVGPIRLTWVAEHFDFHDRGAAGGQFSDRQVRGPFKSWVHRHRVEPDGAGACVLEDRVEFEVPGGRIGHLLAGWLARRQVASMLARRHRIMTDLFNSQDQRRGTAPQMEESAA